MVPKDTECDELIGRVCRGPASLEEISSGQTRRNQISNKREVEEKEKDTQNRLAWIISNSNSIQEGVPM